MSTQMNELVPEIFLLVQENERLVRLAYMRLSTVVGFPQICRLAYLLYPEFFLKGIVVNNCNMVINDLGDLVNDGPHHPSLYSEILMVSFLQAIAKTYEFPIYPGLIGLFLQEIAVDFSREYMSEFPYVIRVVSGNTFKRKEYESAFGQARVEFLSYEFVEIQGTVEEIVQHKLDQLKEVDVEVVMVDDTALELVALDGFPGPYVKSLFQCSQMPKLEEKLTKLGDNRAFVVHTIGVKFKGVDYVQAVRFPVIWRTPDSPGHNFNPYCYYKHRPLTDLNGFFRHVIAFWIKIILQRINTRTQSMNNELS